jgi:hypothetical protein
MHKRSNRLPSYRIVTNQGCGVPRRTIREPRWWLADDPRHDKFGRIHITRPAWKPHHSLHELAALQAAEQQHHFVRDIRAVLLARDKTTTQLAMFLGVTIDHVRRVMAGRYPMTLNDVHLMGAYVREPTFTGLLETAQTWGRISARVDLTTNGTVNYPAP